MAKIPFLHGQKRTNGKTAWHWKPSPGLRKKGWSNRFLGDGEGKNPPADVVTKAFELNRQLESWKLGFEVRANTTPIPKKWLFSDLIDAYRASENYRTEIGDSTRKEYDSRIRQLTYWAQDGALPVRQIDQQMVKDLKAELLAPAEDGTAGSKHKCAAMLRVLRILMNFACGERIISANPTKGVPIPTPPSRIAKMEWREVEDIAAIARAKGDEDTAFLLELAFWSMQRRADLLQLNRLSWRTFEAVDPRDRGILVGTDAEVRGFRLLPQKTKKRTGKWVDAPMPPFMHERIAARFEKSQWLFPHPDDPSSPMPEHTAQRSIRALLDDAGYPDHQLRDMRRSGMSWFKDMGALQSNIFAISGHAVMGKTSIVDTYMPPDTKAACAAVAAVCRTMAAIEAREQAK